jgi:hypothetical protein
MGKVKEQYHRRHPLAVLMGIFGIKYSTKK